MQKCIFTDCLHTGKKVEQKTNRHEFASRGNHKNELVDGDYIIVGAFQEESNAQHMVDQLKKLSYEANYGFLSQRNQWYIHLGSYGSIDLAKSELEKYRQVKMFKDAWLLTVVD